MARIASRRKRNSLHRETLPSPTEILFFTKFRNQRETCGILSPLGKTFNLRTVAHLISRFTQSFLITQSLEEGTTMSFYLELQLNNNVQTTQSSPLSEITQRELAEFAASPAKHSFPLPFRNFCRTCIVFHPTRNFSQQRNNPLQLSTAFDNGVSYLETETHQLAIKVYQLASNLRRRDARVYARKCITQRRVY